MSSTENLRATKAQLKSLNAAIPQTAAAFGALGQSVKTDGALSFKEKEYVALGIAVAIRCEPCILLHVEALLRARAARKWPRCWRPVCRWAAGRG